MKNSDKIKNLFNNKKFVLIFGIIFVIAVLSIVGYFTVLFDQDNETKQPTQTTQTVTEQPTQGENGDTVATEPTEKPRKDKGNKEDKDKDNNKRPNDNKQDNKKPEPTKKPANKPVNPKPTMKPGKNQPDTSYEKVEIETVKKELESKLKKCYVGMTSEELEKVMGEGLEPLENSIEYGYQYNIGNGKEIVFIFTNRLFDCMLRENGKFTKQIVIGR